MKDANEKALEKERGRITIRNHLKNLLAWIEKGQKRAALCKT